MKTLITMLALSLSLGAMADSVIKDGLDKGQSYTSKAA